jgi:predicted transposase YdaD
MAFRFLHSIVSLSYEHILQEHKKLPLILSFCMYHGKTSPYPYSTSIYDCYQDPEFAKKFARSAYLLVKMLCIVLLYI